MGILRHSHNLEVPGMLEIIAEVLSDRMAVFEIFLLKETVDDSDVARGWRVLFIHGAAFDDLRPDGFEIIRACPQP